VSYIIALFCLSLLAGGCQQDQRRPNWGDFSGDAGDAGDTQTVEGETFVPKERPADSVCANGWCWVHPRPMAHNVQELEPVEEKLHGVVELDVTRGPERLVWDDGIQILGDPLSNGDEDIVDLTVAEDGWLALTDGGILHFLGTEGERGRFDLPGQDFTRVEGNSLAEFVVGTNVGGGLIRRGGGVVQVDTVPENLRATTMWSNGDLWQMSESPPADPPMPNRRRWFPVPEVQGDGLNLSLMVFGPAPTSECANLGPWASFPFSLFVANPFRWNSSLEAWNEPAPKSANTRDFACLSSSELLAVTHRGSGYIYDGERWEQRFWSLSNSQNFSEVAVLDRTIFVGGPLGSLATRNGGETNVVTEGFQVPRAVEGAGLRIEDYADLWVSEDNSTAIVIESGNFHRLTSGTNSPFDRSGIGGSERFSPASTSEVWGVSEPRFTLSERGLYERIEEDWKRVDLPGQEGGNFEGSDIAGHSEDAVWVATEQDLFRYNGQSWERLSRPGTALRRTIDDEELTLTRMLVEKSGDTFVTAESRIYELVKRDDAWQMTSIATAPCNRVSAMYRGPDESLWVAGDDTCVARYDLQNWQVYEPTFDWGIPTASVPPDPLTSWEFVRQPDADRPLVVSRPGILEPTADGTLERSYAGNMVDAVYLDSFDITLVLHDDGILAKYE